MIVRLTSVLSRYTEKETFIKISGDTLGEVIEKLDKKYPGIKFRFIDEHNQIRRHMKIFVNKIEASTLNMKLDTEDEIFIVQALSGG